MKTNDMVTVSDNTHSYYGCTGQVLRSNKDSSAHIVELVASSKCDQGTWCFDTDQLTDN